MHGDLASSVHVSFDHGHITDLQRPKTGRGQPASASDATSQLSNAGQFLMNTAEEELKKALSHLDLSFICM